MNLHVIETQYKGYRFRSRLEARWAVFLDSLGIAWEYEREGYDLDGLWYLPDFWLPEASMFVEIKPGDPQSIELEKCRRLCASFDGRATVLLLAGNPRRGAYDGTLYQWTPLEEDETGAIVRYDLDAWQHVVFADCDRCDSEVWLSSADYGACTIKHNPQCAGDKWPQEHGPIVSAAYDAARAARFEHGEGGAQ